MTSREWNARKAWMIGEALEEDAREGSSFDLASFGDFFPEEKLTGEEWREVYDAYREARDTPDTAPTRLWMAQLETLDHWKSKWEQDR